jgi:L-2-hydroxyglutarate oxidase LhgO
MPDFEITIVGAGVVGLAIAARLSERHPHLLVLERNDRYGKETSSRNSEVIHAGIYYKPGSLKATLCVEGRERLYGLCEKHRIGHRRISKIITATDDGELQKLNAIVENGRSNGAELKLLTAAETRALEPNIQTVGSIFSPSTGIISAHELMDYFAHATTEQGGTLLLRTQATRIEKQTEGYAITIDEQGSTSTFTSEIVINAAGLGADRVVQFAGIDIDAAGYRLSFAKGSYFSVSSEKSKLVSRLVYPVPGNESLGVHAVVDLGGRLKFGPDVEYVDGPPFDFSVEESKRHVFGNAIRKILPQISDADISPEMSGIRPKLQHKGEAAKDFIIVHEKERGLEGFVNLIGIESPGLTASPAIAHYVERLLF